MLLREALLTLLLCFARGTSGEPNQPPDPDPNRFAQEIAAFRDWDSKNAVPTQPVLFVGSSSVRLWRTHEDFPNLPVVNRGFGGSHISDVRHFLEDTVLRYKPKVIVFYAGDNDIAAGKSAARVCGDYRRFVQLVQARLPDVHIILITIKPSASRWPLWPEMKKANDLIRDYCRQDQQLFFADLGAPLLGPDGRPNPDLFLSDRLHLNGRGYALWADALRPVLQQALAPRRTTAARP